MSKEGHIERTANEPREPSLHRLTISHIAEITPNIRLFRLEIPPDDTIKFLPGQWVDLYPPAEANIPKPGGFTITSSPSRALSPSSSPQEENPFPYIELAVQASPSNPAAAYLFQPAPQLLHTPVTVRVGGSFVFPPPPSLQEDDDDDASSSSAAAAAGSVGVHNQRRLRRVVLVAGGMGVNPLVSMLSWIAEQGPGECDFEVRVLYSVRDPSPGGGMLPRDAGGVLFLERIVRAFESGRVRGRVRLFLTGTASSSSGDGDDVVRCGGVDVPFLRRRMTVRDVEEAVGRDKEAAVVYICGVPSMTDEFVQALVSPEGLGMEKRRVLFEKWW
ncbi:hypothetical protein VTK56DRAFT_9435 [Thermocarpiscus australiensis]